MKVILASGSKQRQNILSSIGLKYDVIKSNVKESSNKLKPDAYVEELSLNKAISAKNQINEKAIIISADTIVYCNEKIYEKPKTKEEAINNLKELSSNKNIIYTGVTILDLYQNKQMNFSSTTECFFRKITEEEMIWYSENDNDIFNCCGYTPLGKGAIFIEKINGDYNSMFGLSPSILFAKLKELGYEIKDFEFIN